MRPNEVEAKAFYRHQCPRQIPEKCSKHGKCEGKSHPELGSKDVDDEATCNHSDCQNTIDEASSQESRTDEPITMLVTHFHHRTRIKVIIAAGFFPIPFPTWRRASPYYVPVMHICSSCFANVASLVDR